MTSNSKCVGAKTYGLNYWEVKSVRNTIVGIVYRHPQCNIDEFSQSLSETMGIGRIFPMGSIADYSIGKSTVVKFHFTN